MISTNLSLEIHEEIFLYCYLLSYCNAILAGATKATTDRLQRVLNAAARVVSNTRKFDPELSNMMHIDFILVGSAGESDIQA